MQNELMTQLLEVQVQLDILAKAVTPKELDVVTRRLWMTKRMHPWEPAQCGAAVRYKGGISICQ